MKKGYSAAIVAMSNLNTWKQSESLEKLLDILKSYNFKVNIGASAINSNLSPQEKGEELNKFFEKNTTYIFDISGGDSANMVLEFLDWNVIDKSNSTFFGLSDLTVLLNSIYAMTKKQSIHFMIKNVFERPVDFYKEFFKHKHSLSNINYEFWKGTSTKQKVVLGGNIRCLLKLAGTRFFPDFSDKILFLESLSGDWHRISSLLTHLKHLEVFNKIEALVLGEFTQLEKDNDSESVKTLFIEFFKNYNFSIVKTSELGHGRTKGLLYIGGKYQFSN